MLENLTTLLSVTTPVTLMILLWVMAQISRRFGEVTHRPPIFRWYYVAISLLIAPLAVRVVAVGMPDTDRADLGGNTVGAMFHDIPLALAITLGIVIAWRYWGWLIYAREGQSPVPPGRK